VPESDHVKSMACERAVPMVALKRRFIDFFRSLLKSTLVTVGRASQMLTLYCDPRIGAMFILSDRTDKSKFAKAPILFLISITLVAALNIVLFSLASISLLGVNTETLTRSRSYNSHLKDKVVGALASHMDSDASPVPTQTKFPNASNADNMSSSTPVLPSSGMLIEKTLAAPVLKPTTDRKASTTAVETSNGSTRALSTDETSPPELSPSQEVRAPPASMADAGNPAQDASGATMPALAISHEQRDQRFRNFEKQRHHASVDEGSLAFAPEIDFPKQTQIKESTRFYGSSAAPEWKPPVRYAAPHGRGAKAGNIANKLNHAELTRLVQHSRALR
jgi:hypothetical protein